MMHQRLLVALTVLNFMLLASSLGQARDAEAEARGSAPVLRGRALEIMDDQGRIRASITVQPADSTFKMPDGTRGYPETVLLRLITPEGRPNVKIGATERGSGLLLSGKDDPTYVQILSEGPRTSLKLSDKDGRKEVIRP